MICREADTVRPLASADADAGLDPGDGSRHRVGRPDPLAAAALEDERQRSPRPRPPGEELTHRIASSSTITKELGGRTIDEEGPVARDEVGVSRLVIATEAETEASGGR